MGNLDLMGCLVLQVAKVTQGFQESQGSLGSLALWAHVARQVWMELVCRGQLACLDCKGIWAPRENLVTVASLACLGLQGTGSLGCLA